MSEIKRREEAILLEFAKAMRPVSYEEIQEMPEGETVFIFLTNTAIDKYKTVKGEEGGKQVIQLKKVLGGVKDNNLTAENLEWLLNFVGIAYTLKDYARDLDLAIYKAVNKTINK